MRTPLTLSAAALVCVGLAACAQPGDAGADRVRASTTGATADGTDPDCEDLAPRAPGARPESPMPTTEEEWKAKLTPEQYRVLRREGTERAYTGEYLKHDADGVYGCAGCGTQLYDSGVKFEDGGWPNFTEALPGAVGTKDVGGGVLEVHCAKCKGHLGHIFNDGPGPTKKRH